jgi:hypothetical protein
VKKDVFGQTRADLTSMAFPMIDRAWWCAWNAPLNLARKSKSMSANSKNH